MSAIVFIILGVVVVAVAVTLVVVLHHPATSKITTGKVVSGPPVVVPPPTVPPTTLPSPPPISSSINLTMTPVRIGKPTSYEVLNQLYFPVRVEKTGFEWPTASTINRNKAIALITMSSDEQVLLARARDSTDFFFLAFQVDNAFPFVYRNLAPNSDMTILVPLIDPNDANASARIQVMASGEMYLRPKDQDYFAAGTLVALRPFKVSWNRFTY